MVILKRAIKVEMIKRFIAQYGYNYGAFNVDAGLIMQYPKFEVPATIWYDGKIVFAQWLSSGKIEEDKPGKWRKQFFQLLDSA